MSFIATVPAVEGGSGIAGFQHRAAKFNAVLSLPAFETTPADLKATVAETIRQGNAGLDAIAALDQRKTTFLVLFSETSQFYLRRLPDMLIQ